MVTVHLDGRLGNQMFQVAAAAAHADYLGTEWWACEIHESGTPLRAAFTNLASRILPCGAVHTAETVAWREPHFAYAAIPTNVTHLIGYFQSARYWVGREKLIRSLFPLRDGVCRQYGPQPIVAHVRRGDYLQKPDYHVPLPIEYYRNAFLAADAGPDVPVIVHTDDPEWCRDQFGASVTIKSPPHATVTEALWDFATAGAVVIANSSLSWWGAYLGQCPRVFAPSRWFGPKGPQDTQDLLPRDWTVIPV